MRDRLPFGVVGSNTIVTREDGGRARGREYPWGRVNIEDKVGMINLYVKQDMLRTLLTLYGNSLIVQKCSVYEGTIFLAEEMFV